MVELNLMKNGNEYTESIDPDQIQGFTLTCPGYPRRKFAFTREKAVMLFEIDQDDSKNHYDPLAMRYLLNAAGVENFIVIGEASSSPQQTETTSHSWMAIRMDDGWYYTDPTWNDTNQQPEEMGRHFYFNLGYDELMSGRSDAWTVNNMGTYPQENLSANSWYARNGRLASSLEDLQVMIEDYVSAYEADPSISPIFSARFTDQSVYEQAQEEFAVMMLQTVQDYSALDWQNGLYLCSDPIRAVDWFVPWTAMDNRNE